MLRLGLVTLVVGDYDEAIAYYTGVLGFELTEDTELGGGKRWVVVAPPSDRGSGSGSGSGTSLLLAKAVDDHQSSRVGDQTGGRVAFFLQTDDFDAEYARLSKAGVRFTEQARTETYGQVVVFQDLYGNRWDLLQLR